MLGKLNLVDLAGSENIQRSEAENKRAAEAGLISQGDLLSPQARHQRPGRPQRATSPTESPNSPGLLQDSLGGRTKTCTHRPPSRRPQQPRGDHHDP